MVIYMDINQLARAVTRVGTILLESGAETYRVEDTMSRVCKVFGADVVDAYVTPTMLLISFSIKGELVHNIKRTSIKSVDLTKIDRVNAVSRYIVNHPMNLEEFMEILDKIDREKKYDDYVMLLGAAISTFGFGFFFGGTIKDAICALVLGFLLKLFVMGLNKIDFNSFFTNLLGGAFTTIGAFIFSYLGLCDSLDKVIIATIMLLVPGLALTNAIRDSVSGDLLSGLARTVEAIFIAVAIALGSGLVFALIGGM